MAFASLSAAILTTFPAAGKEFRAEVSVGPTNEERSYFNFLNAFEIGVTDFTSPDYANYPETDRGFMDLNNGKSIHIGVSLFEAKVPFNCRRTVGLNTGLGLVWNNYVFDEDITLIKEGGMVVPTPIGSGYKKSKFSTFGLNVPVVVGVKIKSITVAGGVYGNLILSQRTKYKKPKHKNKGVGYANMLQGGVTARIGFKCVNVFANYALTDLFKHDRGPGGQPLTVGIGIW